MALLFDDFSLALTAFFMKMIGLWFTDNSKERWCRRVGILCTMFACLFGTYIQTSDIYYTTEFESVLFDLANLLSVIVPMFKFTILLWRRKKLFRLITYMVDNFLNAKYDDFELQILMDCKRKSKFFVCIFILFTEVTVLSYACTPLIENLSRNESDKAFPFRMWIKSIPLQETPYYEICYTVQVQSIIFFNFMKLLFVVCSCGNGSARKWCRFIDRIITELLVSEIQVLLFSETSHSNITVLQAVSVYMVGRTYFSLDNILCIINLHLAGQFRMLQYRLSEKYTKNQKKNDESRNLLDLANNATDIFKSCIRQHQALVEYCEEVDAVFSPCVLIQVLAFSIFICLDGYQMLLVSRHFREANYFRVPLFGHRMSVGDVFVQL
ncbi:uncharacterized protein LOC100879656 [Megachile rotundata]|uniref:uncharacterized protein LOC100879656 n=1 Tax=Megachile rotundata TaxID=143995 RepID=UPI003FD34B90